MSTIITRAGKGSPLTNNEVDANFVNLNTDKVETITSADGSIVVTPSGTTIDLAVSAASPASTLLAAVRNTTGATLTKGTAVYISGATGQISTVSKALATSDATSAQTLGLITSNLANNSNGYVTVIGLITNINTSAYTDGQQLYLSPITAGTLTATKPYAPQHLVYVAIVEHAHPTQGKLFVKVQNGYEMDELHNVSAQSPTTGQTLVYNASTSLWEKSFAPIISGTTIDNTVIGGTTPAAGTFTTLTATGNINLTQSTTTVNSPSGTIMSFVDGGLSPNTGAYLQFGNSATSASTQRAAGANTNISIYWLTKGTGFHSFNTNGATGTQQMVVSHTASAVNYLQVTGSATGSGPIISTVGSDTNVGMAFRSKGSGFISFGQDSTNQFEIIRTASAVNRLRVTGSTAGNAPIMSAEGSDTNIDLTLTPKGTGTVRANGPFAATSIDNTPVGATTPATGVFTTLTAQTEVLKGTGQNLILQSNTWTAAWSPGNLTAATTVATTDPLGTNTAYQLTESTDASPVAHAIGQGFTTPLFAGSTYTWSMYIKAANRSWAYVSNFDNTRRGAWFDLSTGTVGTVEAGVTAVISNQGGGWYRCSVTTTTPSGVPATYPYITIAPSNGVENYTGTGVVSLYVWRAQLEINATPSTYIATTSSIVWGIPRLSFLSAATSGIGLESNGSLFVQPAGTGALQASPTTSTTAGGNIRGAGAVDWQTYTRTAASQVASGFVANIAGGYQNTASGGVSGVLSGTQNTAAGALTVISGGIGNTTTLSNHGNSYSFVGSGYTNTAGGVFNFIGGGYTNSGTSATAVTTQSATMNATTAVTLAASNASIKVGQVIAGTSISSFPPTYVAAISGTSLTLSQAASGSSTSTLSFFTPHGVVVGGGNNQATGSYSFIGGGGDAGTAANRNVASGDWSSVLGGNVVRATGKWSTAVGGGGNQATGEGAVVVGGGSYGGGLAGSVASGTSAFIGAGYGNTANGYCSTVVGGAGNVASNNFSFVGGGTGNSANTSNTAILGGVNGTTRSIDGMQAMPACNAPIAATQGCSQAALLVLAVETTNATATVLRSNSSAASTTNQIILPNNSAYYFKGSVIANVTGAANGASWSFEGAIMRGANAASTVLMGTPAINRVAATAGATAWLIALTADTTNGGLAVTVTGAASTTIRWVCKAETCEVTF
jgi:hypothetical protein